MLKLKNQDNFLIRISSPDEDIVKEILSLECYKDKYKKIDNVAIREIAEQQKIRSIVLISDKKHLLIIEVKDDSKELFEEAMAWLCILQANLPCCLTIQFLKPYGLKQRCLRA